MVTSGSAPPAKQRLIVHPSKAFKSVLLVEDEPFVAMVAQQLLEDDGFLVTVAVTGSQALSCVAQKDAPPDVAIVDLGLPDMRGEDLVRQLRALRDDLPVVIASGYGVAEMSATFQGLSRMGFVSKPYDGRALYRALSDVGVI